MRMLRLAEGGNYGVPCVNCYNFEAVMATKRAAEKKKSPAIIEVFPWSMKQFGDHFIRMCADVVQNSTVPLALHLDHAQEEDMIEKAIESGLFDSIMVDMSVHSEEKNIELTRKWVEKALNKKIAVEAELGRIDGGEDGIANTEKLEAVMTKPEEAVHYVRKTGVQMLAPSIGNIHGDYGSEGPRATIDLNILKKVSHTLQSEGIPVVLHGTNDFDAELFRECVASGARKINVNKVVAQDYYKYTEENFGKKELTKVIEEGIDKFQASVEACMDALGSSGRA